MILIAKLVLIALLGPCAVASAAEPPTLEGKVLAGYQGWYTAEGDGTGLGWSHWGWRGQLTPQSVTVDLWPDVSEYEVTYETPLHHANGERARLFSSGDPSTVGLHFRWMREYGIDGVFLQRFGQGLEDARLRGFRNKVLQNVRNAATRNGRCWALMYDLSGLDDNGVRALAEDWRTLVEAGIRDDPTYLRHDGKPLVAVWGVGFNDGRAYGLDAVRDLLEVLRSDTAVGGNSIMLGVPYGWRDGTRDAVDHPALHKLLESYADIISPWSVGRYRLVEEMERHLQNRLLPDRQWCARRGKMYLPVAWPGFSWHNLEQARGRKATLAEVPRNGGHFFWSQIVAARQAGCRSLYLAMFDEFDEATAILKATDDPPVDGGTFLTNGDVPPDHYLWLTGEGGRLLRNPKADEGFPIRR